MQTQVASCDSAFKQLTIKAHSHCASMPTLSVHTPILFPIIDTANMLLTAMLMLAKIETCWILSQGMLPLRWRSRAVWMGLNAERVDFVHQTWIRMVIHADPQKQGHFSASGPLGHSSLSARGLSVLNQYHRSASCDENRSVFPPKTRSSSSWESQIGDCHSRREEKPCCDEELELHRANYIGCVFCPQRRWMVSFSSSSLCFKGSNQEALVQPHLKV